MTFNKELVRDEIERALATIPPERETEIAFFGGSFTGIDRALMLWLLKLGKEYIDAGRVSSLRCSTRPDYINAEVVKILREYGMKTVELGIQSVSDKVLRASKRGHTFNDIKNACACVRDGGLSLVGQMMIGLPGSVLEDELETAAFINNSGAAGARVYPAVVFKNTELAEMTDKGAYTPLTEEEAVFRTKEVLKVFARKGVPVIRVGLHSGENLNSGRDVLGGAFHPAIGEMAMSAIYRELLAESLAAFDSDLSGKTLVVEVPMGEVSKVAGQRRANFREIEKKYPLIKLKTVENESLKLYNIKVSEYKSKAGGRTCI